MIDPSLQDAMIVSVVDFYFEEQSAKAWYMSEFLGDYLPEDAADLLNEQLAELEDVLLIQRNRNWIDVIAQAATQHDDIFIGFGAAHLFGTDGVLQLLENEGWTITAF